MVADHLFRTGAPSRTVPCSMEGKLIYLGSSGPFVAVEEAIFDPPFLPTCSSLLLVLRGRVGRVEVLVLGVPKEAATEYPKRRKGKEGRL
jgi:hypothetical protein